MHYEICLNIIEYNGIFHTCGREAVSLVSSVHSYTEAMCIQYFMKIFLVVVLNLLHPTIKAQQKWSGENLTNLSGGAAPGWIIQLMIHFCKCTISHCVLCCHQMLCMNYCHKWCWRSQGVMIQCLHSCPV